MNRLRALSERGQSVWLDFLSRRLLIEGKLKELVEDDGITGVTSNPAIFEKAIAESSDYDEALKKAGDADPMALYERLALDDIRHAADTIPPGGYVSLEVSPYLAMDTDATIAEAKRLWRAVGRKNVMIKVPATAAGLSAIRHLIGEGININITLLFSQKVYEEVVEAYLAGLEELVKRGGNPAKVASVASFFVSRIDTAVDKHPKVPPSLHGKVAIANAKLAYQRFKRRFTGARWERLQALGATAQRLLWASTGTKNPAYRDVLYVEELIAPHTINTMPPSTMDAFRDHGKVRLSLEEGVAEAEETMARLERAGVSIDAVTAALTEEGVALFAEAFDKLLGAVARKRESFLGEALDRESGVVGIKSELEAWRKARKGWKLWARDATLWTGADEAQWLGWLDIVPRMEAKLSSLDVLAGEVRRRNFSHAVLLGMGGSSLGPEVLARTFGRQPGFPELLVLDSTDPAEIRALESRIDLARTLFIVSSKSGSTLEPNSLYAYFASRVKDPSRFIAITDPGSSLERLAQSERFAHIAHGDPAIGGRYSVLSAFGLVPAAVMGLDLRQFLARTQTMIRSCAAAAPPHENPGLALGILLGKAAREGRDKVTIIASPGLRDFGAWLEQLLAESTGKRGRGLIPVDGETLGAPAVYGRDRLFVQLRLGTARDPLQEERLEALEKAGHPVVRIDVTSPDHLGQEFFRWEIATAVAGVVLGINPFDQPDVEASKVKTRALTAAFEKTGSLPPETPFLVERGVKLFADPGNAALLAKSTLAGVLEAHFARVKAGDYVALLAYIERNTLHAKALNELRLLIRDRTHVASAVGFGPRFLHSTGQAYKGGPNSGVFLQITCDDPRDIDVPGQKYSFGIIKAAAARGDFEVLAERGRRALRVHLGGHVAEGLAVFGAALRQALE